MRTTTARRQPATRTANSGKRPAASAAPPAAASAVRPAPEALFDLTQKPGYYNAAAKAALLRRTSAPPHDQLLVDFSRPECLIELFAGGTALLAGAWTVQAAAGGRPLPVTGPWDEVCWETDEDGDYLEIELPLAGGWRLERQMLLARRDRFLLLADVLLGPVGQSPQNKPNGANGSTKRTAPPQPPELHYTASLSLDARAAFRPAAETREGWLEAKNRRVASVVPLALPEWRAEFCHAGLTSDSGHLKLEQKGLGGNLYAPLWIDLDSGRLRRPLTWRRITVAENLAAVTRDVASAFRIQVGGEQWVVYRSLAKCGNRSFLGHNSLYEFVCHRFLPTGDPETIVEIE